MVLQGDVVGQDHKELISNALDIAAKYYSYVDRDCISIELSHECAESVDDLGITTNISGNSVIGFAADFEARVAHKYHKYSLSCRNCGEETE